MSKLFSSSLLVFTAAALLLAGCALSSEPEIAQNVALPTPVPEITAPAERPDVTRGAAFFAEHCSVCHGPTGAGDGQMVLDERLPNPPPDLSDPATAQGRTPIDYMTIITYGNTLAGMPPFARYSEQERWDAAAYAYTGWLTPDTLARGAEVYAAECVSCHGATGAGDGPDAAAVMPDLSSLETMSARSDAELVQATAGGGSDETMHAFGDRLGESDLRAVVGYVRTLTLHGAPGFAVSDETGQEQAQQPAPAATEEAAVSEIQVTEEPGNADAQLVSTEEPTTEGTAVVEAVAEPETITVAGRVTNGTPDGTIPAGTELTLHMFDPPDFTETSLQTPIQADGSFTFSDVPHMADRTYVISLEYQDIFFSSTVYNLQDPANPTIDTSLEIFERTSDPSVVHVEAGVMRITFSSLGSGYGMEVLEVLRFVNTSDRLFLTDEELSENRRVALRIPLPPGATGVAFQPGEEGSRMIVSEDGAAIIDTQPLRPGPEEVFFSYLIPYQDGAIIEQEFPYPLQGQFHVLLESGQVSFESQMFQSGGEPMEMSGRTFEQYSADVDLPTGSAINYTLNGAPAAVVAAEQVSTQQSTLSPLVLILVIAGLALIGVGGFMFLMRQDGGKAADKAIDALVDEIAQLDDQHDQGALNHDYYQRKRAELKAKLAELMRDQGKGES